MRCRAALGLLLALATTACAQDEPRMPPTCTDTDAAGYERALGAAAQAGTDVRLPGGVAISECLRRARTDADLQNLGLVLQRVAERLAEQAGDGGPSGVAAARELGYLGGATAAGSVRSNGISAELARRVAVTGSTLDDDPATVAALREGQDAGEAGG